MRSRELWNEAYRRTCYVLFQQRNAWTDVSLANHYTRNIRYFPFVTFLSARTNNKHKLVLILVDFHLLLLGEK